MVCAQAHRFCFAMVADFAFGWQPRLDRVCLGLVARISAQAGIASSQQQGSDQLVRLGLDHVVTFRPCW